jgi:5-aminolevulinate synthase
MSNLQVLGRRCPVMSKALAVQSARLHGSKRFTSCAAGVASMQPLRAPTGKRALHTTGGHPASLASGGYEKNERGKPSSSNACISIGF